MSPAAERAVQLHAVGQRLSIRRPAFGPVVRGVHPVEVRCGETEHSFFGESAPALAEKREALLERKVLEEVLGIDGLEVGEGESLRHVHDAIDARELADVDVDPSRDRLLTATDVETVAGGTRRMDPPPAEERGHGRRLTTRAREYESERM